MMVCGKCGGGITGFEKQKYNKTEGTTRWYIYYGCTGGKDRHCKNPYVREESVIAQLCEIVDQLDIDELGARHPLGGAAVFFIPKDDAVTAFLNIFFLIRS